MTGSAIAVREANRRVLETRKFGEALIFDLADKFGDIPGTDPVRRMILQRGSDYLNGLAASRGNDRDLALDEAEAFRRLADLQGVNQVNLGDWRGAYGSLRKSEAILTPFAARKPGDIEVGKRLAGVYSEAVTMLTAEGELYAARDYAQKAVALSARLVALQPADHELREVLAESWEEMGSLLGNPALPNFGDVSGSMAAYEKSRALRTVLASEDPNVDSHQPLAGDWTREARVWFYSLGDRRKALEGYRKAAEISGWILAHSARNRWQEFNVAVRNENLVEPLLAEGSVAEARRRADDALTTLTALDAKDNGVAAFRKEVAMALRVRGTVDAAAGRHPAALGLYGKALAAWRGLGDRHVEYANDTGYRDLWRVMADSQLAARDYSGAMKSAGEEFAIDNRLLKVCPENANALENLAIAERQTGDALRAMGNQAQARNSWQAALDQLEGLRKSGRLTPVAAVRRDALERAIGALPARH